MITERLNHIIRVKEKESIKTKNTLRPAMGRRNSPYFSKESLGSLISDEMLDHAGPDGVETETGSMFSLPTRIAADQGDLVTNSFQLPEHSTVKQSELWKARGQENISSRRSDNDQVTAPSSSLPQPGEARKFSRITAPTAVTKVLRESDADVKAWTPGETQAAVETDKNISPEPHKFSKQSLLFASSQLKKVIIQKGSTIPASHLASLENIPYEGEPRDLASEHALSSENKWPVNKLTENHKGESSLDIDKTQQHKKKPAPTAASTDGESIEPTPHTPQLMEAGKKQAVVPQLHPKLGNSIANSQPVGRGDRSDDSPRPGVQRAAVELQPMQKQSVLQPATTPVARESKKETVAVPPSIQIEIGKVTIARKSALAKKSVKKRVPRNHSIPIPLAWED